MLEIASEGQWVSSALIFSRLPAIFVGVIAVWRELTVMDNAPALLLSLSFVACCLIWATADWKLLSPQGMVRRAADRWV